MSNSSTLLKLSWLLIIALMMLVYTDNVNHNIDHNFNYNINHNFDHNFDHNIDHINHNMEGWQLFFAWATFIFGLITVSSNVVHHTCPQYNVLLGTWIITKVKSVLSSSQSSKTDLELQSLSPTESWHSFETSGSGKKKVALQRSFCHITASTILASHIWFICRSFGLHILFI